MVEYHVGAGEISGAIYAGTYSKDGKTWRTRSDVTDEAIAAVRDHMINRKQFEENWKGYEWTRKRDGKRILLTIEIKEV